VKSFNSAARNYQSESRIQKKMAVWLAEWIDRKRTGSALEIAAGTGNFTTHLLPWNGPLLVSDAAPAMVEIGKNQFSEIEWRIFDAGDLPEKRFDFIFSSSFLQWAKDPKTLLQHWRSRLNPDGKIVAGFFAAPTLSELETLLPKSAPLRWREPEDWKMIFERAGFLLKRFEAKTVRFYFPSALELFRNLHRIGAAPKQKVSPARLRRIIDEYDKKFGNKNGVCSTWTFVRLEAT